jgi:hypothetical protein
MQSSWWVGFSGILFLFNFAIMALFIGGFIFFLIKIASIDKSLKEIAEKINK